MLITPLIPYPYGTERDPQPSTCIINITPHPKMHWRIWQLVNNKQRQLNELRIIHAMFHSLVLQYHETVHCVAECFIHFIHSFPYLQLDFGLPFLFAIGDSPTRCAVLVSAGGAGGPRLGILGYGARTDRTSGTDDWGTRKKLQVQTKNLASARFGILQVQLVGLTSNKCVFGNTFTLSKKVAPATFQKFAHARCCSCMCKVLARQKLCKARFCRSLQFWFLLSYWRAPPPPTPPIGGFAAGSGKK